MFYTWEIKQLCKSALWSNDSSDPFKNRNDFFDQVLEMVRREITASPKDISTLMFEASCKSSSVRRALRALSAKSLPGKRGDEYHPVMFYLGGL